MIIRLTILVFLLLASCSIDDSKKEDINPGSSNVGSVAPMATPTPIPTPTPAPTPTPTPSPTPAASPTPEPSATPAGLDRRGDDHTPPEAANFKISTDLSESGYTLQWEAGKDDATAVSDLEYYICSGPTLESVDSILKCLAQTKVMDWNRNVTQYAVSDLSPNQLSFYNVIVRDTDKGCHCLAIKAGELKQE